MKFNCFSVTFWFNIFENHNDVLSIFQDNLKNEFDKFNVFNYSENLLAPIITAVNQEKKTNISFSQINLQYNMENISFEDFNIFSNRALNLFDILHTSGINVAHSAIFINAEEADNEALRTITKNTVSPKIANNDLVDMTLKLGKCHEEQFYKIVTILNKKQIKLPQIIDNVGRNIPLPLISWHGALVENEIIDISYEINDKYLFDFTKDYQTTEFYLNKMLYILKEDFKSDVKNIIEYGKF